MNHSERIYYLYHHHAQEGPYALYELADQINTLTPTRETKIFCVGWTHWMRYEDVADLHNVCAARKHHPDVFQHKAAEKLAQDVYQQQQRLSGTGSLAQFRFSAAAKHQSTHPHLIPSPKTTSPWSLILTATLSLAAGAAVTFLIRIFLAP